MSPGPLRIECAGRSASVVKVGPDGWLPVLAGGRRVARSAPALVTALREIGASEAEATDLAEQTLRAWESMPAQSLRSLRTRTAEALRFSVLSISLLGRVVVRIAEWTVRRGPRAKERRHPEQRSQVLPGSPEYGMLRLVHTSAGWAEFEFWSGTSGSLGVYREDGWLPAMRSSGPLFKFTEAAAAAALIAQGVPGVEAEALSRQVIGERRARIAASA